jgi:hypothetical protein
LIEGKELEATANLRDRERFYKREYERYDELILKYKDVKINLPPDQPNLVGI